MYHCTFWSQTKPASFEIQQKSFKITKLEFYSDTINTMRIIVKAKANAKIEMMERVGQPTLDFSGGRPEIVEYKVSIKEPPVAGKANDAIIKVLAKYFDVAPSLVRLVSGASAKRKVFEIFG
jgi:uncharacterized protein YggU (UPF0235/DUF167 family)